MTATFTAERRRPSPTPPRPLRGLPVLFHLMDVSRPKGYAASPPPAFTLSSLTDEGESPELGGDLSGSPMGSTLASQLVSQPPIEPARSFDLETAAELVQTKAYGSLPLESPAPSTTLPSATQETAASSLAGVPEATADVLTDNSSLETPPPGGDAVTLRQRAEERQRKRQEGKRDDWFSTQGKFIVIGFVIALGVTIYFARRGHKPATSPPVAAKTHAHPGDAASGTAHSPPTTAVVKQAAAVESAKITDVHATDKAIATSEPRTALHPPSIPQLADKTSPTSPGDATLFTFSKRTDERVATRTDAAAAPTPAAAPPNTAAPSAPAPSTPAPSAPAAPSLQPQYPSTSYPSTYQPVAPPPAYAPSSAAPGGPALNPAASTMPLYPTTNTASGYRYERTGSSVY